MRFFLYSGRFDSRRYLQVLGQALRFVDARLTAMIGNEVKR